MIQLSKPDITEAEIAAAARVMRTGYFGMGPEVERFEAELVAYLGADRTVVCTNSGTGALHLAVESLGLPPGDEVLVPSLTFAGTFQAVAVAGARPVACDVVEDSGLLDLGDAAARLTSRTRAVMPVHYAGYPGNLTEVYEFAGRHGLRVIEDAAHAFGSRHRGRLVGSFGDIACFSFDGIKNITCGEGGAIVTADREIASRARAMLKVGMESVGGAGDFDVRLPGWRYHMSDLMAAIGRVQLTRFEDELKPVRQATTRRYRERLAAVPHVRLLTTDDEVVPHLLPVRVTGRDRDRIREALRERGYETNVHYKPNHLHARFRSERPLPGAERLYRELVSLPLHHGLTDEHVDDIAGLIESFSGS